MKFSLAAKEFVIAGFAAVRANSVGIRVLAGEWAFGGGIAQDLVGKGIELCFEFSFVDGDGIFLIV